MDRRVTVLVDMVSMCIYCLSPYRVRSQRLTPTLRVSISFECDCGPCHNKGASWNVESFADAMVSEPC